MLFAACAHATPAAPPPAAAGHSSCSAPEYRQLDFWIGDWDVTIHARQSPTSDTWADAKGRQRVDAILGGCAISEDFRAEGPQQPWAGRSYSSWQPAAGKWRQTWVDDQGGYLAFTGGLEGGTMALYGEPRADPTGKPFQMRMIWLDVTRAALRWEWQRSYDEWKTSTVMMRIDYVRRH